MLEERWEVLDEILEKVTTKGGLLDQYLKEMSQSWEGDNERWPKEKTPGWSGDSYAEAIEELRTHINARRAWINANLDQLPTTYYTATFMDGDNEVLSATFWQDDPVKVEPPEIPEREGMLWLGWLLPNGEEYDPQKKYSEDITVNATYVDPSTVVAAQDIFFPCPEIWVAEPTEIRNELMPADAVDTRIVWTSSDESVVTIDADGIASPVAGCLNGAKTASAIITATLVGSGKSASFRLVVYDPNRVDLPQPDSITFEEEMVLEVGTYRQAAFRTEPYPSALNSYNDLEYEIDDDRVAEVSRLGVVTAKRPGTTLMVVKRLNRKTYEMEVVGTVKVTVTERAPEPTPEPAPGPDPTPESVPDSDVTPKTDPTSRVSPSSDQAKAKANTASGKSEVPKTGDGTVSFVTVAFIALAAGICLLVARRMSA